VAVTVSWQDPVWHTTEIGAASSKAMGLVREDYYSSNFMMGTCMLVKNAPLDEMLGIF
jgi:hypothetical protein